MAYSGQAQQLCHRALLHAFDRATIEQFVVTHLEGIEFENVTRRGNFSDETWDFVRWADRAGRLLEVMRAAAGDLPGNAQLKNVLAHIEHPRFVEDRWYARYVPLTTWLVWVVNTGLIVAAVIVWGFNLLDLRRIFFLLVLAVVVGTLGWLLYQRLVGGPVRTFAGFLVLQRLITHSRLERRDWQAFTGTILVGLLLGAVVSAAPDPVRVSFERGTVTSRWRDIEYEIVQHYETPSTMEPQNQVAENIDAHRRFTPSYYTVDLFTGAGNASRNILVTLELIRPEARDLSDERAKLFPGVAFRDVAFDRALAGILQSRRPEDRLSGNDRSIQFALSLDELKGRHTVLFTCQRVVDAQPPATEVSVYVQLSDVVSKAVLSHGRGGSTIEAWEPRLAADRGGAAGLVRVGGRGQRAAGVHPASLGASRRLPFGFTLLSRPEGGVSPGR